MDMRPMNASRASTTTKRKPNRPKKKTGGIMIASTGSNIKTYWVICPECHGRRRADRVLCWKCYGEGGFMVPDVPLKIPVSPIQKLCIRFLVAAGLFGLFLFFSILLGR